MGIYREGEREINRARERERERLCGLGFYLERERYRLMARGLERYILDVIGLGKERDSWG